VEVWRAGRRVVEAEGGVWDLTQWMPGAADFHDSPADARLLAAVEALARLHEALGRLSSAEPMPCPAVERRWRTLLEWEKLTASGWRPLPVAGDRVGPHAQAAWTRLPALIPRSLAALARWRTEPVPVQPCLCDVWHDHVLFTGDRVTGLIDYGAAKVDHVAVDLARLLGSVVGDDEKNWAIALRAYRKVRPLAAEEEELAHFLDETGTVLSVANWLRWLCHGERQIEDRSAAAERLRVLAERMRGRGLPDATLTD